MYKFLTLKSSFFYFSQTGLNKKAGRFNHYSMHAIDNYFLISEQRLLKNTDEFFFEENNDPFFICINILNFFLYYEAPIKYLNFLNKASSPRLVCCAKQKVSFYC